MANRVCSGTNSPARRRPGGQRARAKLAVGDDGGLRDVCVRLVGERNLHGLKGHLPDREYRTQDDDAVNERLKEVAFCFFRMHQHGVSRFRFVGWVVCSHKDLFGYAPPYAMPVPWAETKL